MSAGAMMHVYQVIGAGGCFHHFAIENSNGKVAVTGSVELRPQGYLSAMMAMHRRMGHTITLVEESDDMTVWSVCIGHADFDIWHDLIIECVMDAQDILRGGINGKTNFKSDFASRN